MIWTAIPAASSRASASLRPSLPIVALAMLVIVLTAHLAFWLRATVTTIWFPYHIDYGEGIVWQQMLNMIAGKGYTPIGVFPAIVYHYPPVYHLTVAALTELSGADALAVGRLTSVAATIFSATMVGLLAHRAIRALYGPGPAATGAVLAFLLFPAFQPVAEWAPTMRVDMLACAMGLGGLLLSLAALRHPRLIHLAALCFVLGVYTKQVTIAAPTAAILGLLLTRPRLGLKCLTTSLVLGSALLIALTIATNGGFLRHIILYNINRNEAHRLLMLLDPFATYSACLILACIGASIAVRSVHAFGRADERSTILLILLLYLFIKTVMLAMIMKSGGSSNYLIEWFASIAIFAAIGVAPAIASPPIHPSEYGAPAFASPVAATALLCVVMIQVMPFVRQEDLSRPAAERAHKLDRLVAAIHRTDAPVISDEMTLLIRAKKAVLWEPSIVAELASVGRYDEPRFVALVRAHCFGGFVTEGSRGESLFDSRYNPPVADAMDQAYPRRVRYAGLTLHLPPHGVTAKSCTSIG